MIRGMQAAEGKVLWTLCVPCCAFQAAACRLAASLHPTTRAHCPLAGVSQTHALRGHHWQCLAALSMGAQDGAQLQVKCVR